jgi:dolichyl-phosphate-mannose--protein O-mannosyl transferase
MSLSDKESKYLYIFLIISIGIGIFVRFYGIGNSYLEGDEPSWIVSEIKLHHPGSYDARLNLYEHPPIARWFIGLPTSYISADYTMTVALPPNMNVWAYLAPLKEVYVPLREVSAVFGALSILLIFLIAKNIYGTKAGIWSATIAALSFDLIFYSRWVLSESVFLVMTLFTLYY